MSDFDAEFDEDMARAWRAHPLTKSLLKEIGPAAILKKYQQAKTLEEARGYEEALKMVGRLIAGA